MNAHLSDPLFISFHVFRWTYFRLSDTMLPSVASSQRTFDLQSLVLK